MGATTKEQGFIGSVLCFGVANACGIMLGNVMGEGNLEKAKEQA